jgi:transcriptional regulator with XRE-family HTH domain
MEIKITEVRDLGRILRSVRKSAHVRLDDLAGFAGVSKQFVSDLEHGKETIRLGLVLKVLDEIGLHLKVDVPAAAEAHLEKSLANALPNEFKKD